MTTPAQYRHQITQAQGEAISIEGLTTEQAQAALANLLERQKQLQEIERALNLDLQSQRARLNARSSAASVGSTSRILLSNKNRQSGRAREGELARLEQERSQKVEPLEQLKKELEELLAQLSVTRAELEKRIG